VSGRLSRYKTGARYALTTSADIRRAHTYDNANQCWCLAPCATSVRIHIGTAVRPSPAELFALWWLVIVIEPEQVSRARPQRLVPVLGGAVPPG
jgi:hypothetical protein